MAYTKLKVINTTLNNSIKYITNADKTESIYIGSLNCRADNAHKDMQRIKTMYNKKDGRLGYH